MNPNTTPQSNPLEDARKLWTTLTQSFKPDEATKKIDWHGATPSPRELDTARLFHQFVHEQLTNTVSSLTALQSQLEYLKDQQKRNAIAGLCGALVLNSHIIASDFDPERSLSSPITQAVLARLRELAKDIRKELEYHAHDAIEAAALHAKLLTRGDEGKPLSILPPVAVPPDVSPALRQQLDELQRQRDELNKSIQMTATLHERWLQIVKSTALVTAQHVSLLHFVGSELLDDVDDDTLKSLKARYTSYSVATGLIPAILAYAIKGASGSSDAGAVAGIILQYFNQKEVQPRIQAKHEEAQRIEGLLLTIMIPLVVIPTAVSILGGVMLLCWLERTAVLKLTGNKK